MKAAQPRTLSGGAKRIGTGAKRIGTRAQRGSGQESRMLSEHCPRYRGEGISTGYREERRKYLERNEAERRQMQRLHHLIVTIQIKKWIEEEQTAF